METASFRFNSVSMRVNRCSLRCWTENQMQGKQHQGVCKGKRVHVISYCWSDESWGVALVTGCLFACQHLWYSGYPSAKRRFSFELLSVSHQCYSCWCAQMLQGGPCGLWTGGLVANHFISFPYHTSPGLLICALPEEVVVWWVSGAGFMWTMKVCSGPERGNIKCQRINHCCHLLIWHLTITYMEF